jgi:hypothetical protein
LQRKLVVVVTVASSVLFTGALAACARSYWQCDSLWWTFGEISYDISSNNGRLIYTREQYLYITHVRGAFAFRTDECWTHDPMGEDGASSRRRAAGFEWSDEVDGTAIAPHAMRFVPRAAPLRLRIIAVPWWAIIALAAALPVRAVLLGLRRRRRYRLGLCRACGYDVRATPDHCPECGLPSISVYKEGR